MFELVEDNYFVVARETVTGVTEPIGMDLSEMGVNRCLASVVANVDLETRPGKAVQLVDCHCEKQRERTATSSGLLVAPAVEEIVEDNSVLYHHQCSELLRKGTGCSAAV